MHGLVLYFKIQIRNKFTVDALSLPARCQCAVGSQILKHQLISYRLCAWCLFLSNARAAIPIVKVHALDYCHHSFPCLPSLADLEGQNGNHRTFDLSYLCCQLQNHRIIFHFYSTKQKIHIIIYHSCPARICIQYSHPFYYISFPCSKTSTSTSLDKRIQ